MDRRPARLAAIGLLVAIALAGVAVGISRQAPGTLSTFRSHPLVLDYPASWRVFRYPVVASFFSLEGYIATFPIPDPCTRTTGSVSCGLAGYELPEDSVVMTVMGWGLAGGSSLADPGEGAELLRIQGLPAWRRDLGPDKDTGSERTIEWRIARPNSVNNWVTITAELRGPDIEPLQRQVDAVIASLRWDPPVVPIDRGPVGLAAASEALTRYLAQYPDSDDDYDCFPRAPGERAATVDHAPGGPLVAPSAPVVCSTEFAPTQYELWTATLTMRWGNDPGTSGRWEATLYINGAGEVIGSTTVESDQLPGTATQTRDSHG